MRSIQLLSKRLQLWEVIHLGWLEGSQVDIHSITHTTCVHHCEYPANRNGPLDDSQTYPSLNVQPCDYIESYGKPFPNGNQQLGDFSFIITFITLRNIVKKNWQVLLLSQRYKQWCSCVFLCSSVVLYIFPLCVRLCCNGDVLRVLHTARWLHWTQSFHQPELYLLHHSVCRLNSP